MIAEHLTILRKQVTELQRIVSLFPGLELKKIKHDIEIKTMAIHRLEAYAREKGNPNQMGFCQEENSNQSDGEVGGREPRNTQRK